MKQQATASGPVFKTIQGVKADMKDAELGSCSALTEGRNRLGTVRKKKTG